MESNPVAYMWAHDDILKFIQARITFRNTPASFLYQQIINEIGLQDSVSALDAEKLWESLVIEYKILSQPSLEPDDAAPPEWPFYSVMHDALLAMPSVLPATDATDSALENPLPLEVPAPEETVDQEAARLEEAFRNGELGTVQGVSEEVNEQEIIDELIISEEDGLEEDETEELSVTCLIDPATEFDEIWTEERLVNLIQLRCAKESEITSVGHRPVFMQIIKELGLTEKVTITDAKNKWAYLVKTYQQIKNNDAEAVGGNGKNSTWSLYELMDEAIKDIEATSPDAAIKSRKSPDYIWSSEMARKFIRMRTAKHSEIAQKGHNAIYDEILEKLNLSGKVTTPMARKKWNGFLKRYQDELASGNQNWIFWKDMKQVMKHFKGINFAKLKSRQSPDFLWPHDHTKKFIQLRIAKYSQFNHYASTQAAYIEIMEELSLGHILNPNQLRKKWNYLLHRYREISSTVAADGTSPAPHNWAFYEDMANAMALIPKDFIHNTKVVRSNMEHIWTKEIILKFIHLRGLRPIDGLKRVSVAFREILTELGLQDTITAQQARKKWNYLYGRYVDLCHPEIEEFNKTSWPYFSAMQQAVGNLPFSQILARRSCGQNFEGSEEEVQTRLFKRPHQLVCFLCNKKGKIVNDYFTFEQNQKLLQTQKNVVEIIGQLLGHKVTNVEATTTLCTRCTNLVNEADSVFHRNDKLKSEANCLYKEGSLQARLEEQQIIEQIRISTNIKDTPLTRDAPPSSPDTSECIVYSQRGRKRKVLTDMSPIKTEPMDLDDPFQPRRKKKRGRAKKRGRPCIRSTLIGRGLGDKPTKNTVKGLKIYHCSECEGEFKKYTDLIAHKKAAHTVIDTTELEVEETVLPNGVITYFNKGKVNNSETSHACRQCDKLFLRKDDLWYHQEVAHTDGKGRTKTAFKHRSYDCDECGERFIFKYKLRMHINNKHLNDAGETADDFECGVCGCKLGSLPGLTFHMRKHHKKSLTYRTTTEYLCSDCGFLATSSKKLKDHQDAHCGASLKPKVQCEICGKTVLKVSLKMHKIKMHTDFKEKCDKCGERYATKTDLLRHYNVVHLGILLYTCEVCDEKFATSDALRYHRVKTHQKPSFYCPTCGKCYKRIGELNSHVKRTHDGRRKVEVCQYCSKEYYDRSGLRTHLINKHNVPPEMTYSENYLRKKRVEGLPLAKHLDKRTNTAPPILTHAHIQPQHHPIQQQQQVHTYQEVETPASTLVVTEITENNGQQTVLVDPIATHNMIHQSEVAHMQPMTIHPHMHQAMQPPSNMRVNVLYQMNMHHPGPSHM